MKSLFNKGAWVIIGAILVQLSLGAIYGWSVFTKPLQAAGWTVADTQWPFALGLVTFALTMVWAGRHIHTIGPRRLTYLGGILLGTGYIFAGLFGGTSFWPTLLGVGLLGGAGIGLGYVVPIAVGMQWFPDRKGLITGVAVAGFGLGAMIWVKVAGHWGGWITEYGIGQTFVMYGAIFAMITLLGSIWLRFPADFVPPKKDQVRSKFDFRSHEMIRTVHFWSIFTTFAIGATAGLMCIGLMKQFPSQALEASGMDNILADATSGTAMVIFAIFNAIGRVGWGKISDMIGHRINCDHTGRRRSLVIMAVSQGIFVIAFPYFAGHIHALYFLAAVIGFNFGGNFALFPTITTDTFGHTYFSQNYGYVFLAYGIGGTVGPLLGGYLGNMNIYSIAFMITGVLSLVSAIIISTVRIPTKATGEVAATDIQLEAVAETID